jgi:RPA family protein
MIKMAEKPSQQKRQTAFKARIADLISGEYVVKDGWEPNYILTKGLAISRSNIIGVVVSKSDSEDLNYQSIMLDDGSGRITIRNFEPNNKITDVSIGDIINVIGRPREYGREIYIVPEIVKKIADKKWLEVRKLELQKQDSGHKPADDTKKEEKPVEEKVTEVDDVTQNLLEAVRQADVGEGADIEEVIQKSGIENAEKLINRLLMEGDLFEIKPGRIKVLE